MKEFITDLLQKTNQAKYNLALKQQTLAFSFYTQSNIIHSADSFTNQSPSSSSFCTVNLTNKTFSLNKGLYLLSTKKNVQVPSGTFSNTSFYNTTVLCTFDEEENYTPIQTMRNITIDTDHTGGQLGEFTQTDVLIIDNWNQNLTCYTESLASGMSVNVIYTITPLILI